MQNFHYPTRLGYLAIFLFLLNVISLIIGFVTDNSWFILQGIFLSSIQYYMDGTIAKEEHSV